MQDDDILYGGRWEREKRLLGFSGAQLTAALARRWRFPDSIVRALETAEDPVAAVPCCRLGGIVHVAMLLAEIGLEEPKSPADTIASLPEEIKRALQLDSAWLAEHLPLAGQRPAYRYTQKERPRGAFLVSEPDRIRRRAPQRWPRPGPSC